MQQPPAPGGHATSANLQGAAAGVVAGSDPDADHPTPHAVPAWRTQQVSDDPSPDFQFMVSNSDTTPGPLLSSLAAEGIGQQAEGSSQPGIATHSGPPGVSRMESQGPPTPVPGWITGTSAAQQHASSEVEARGPIARVSLASWAHGPTAWTQDRISPAAQQPGALLPPTSQQQAMANVQQVAHSILERKVAAAAAATRQGPQALDGSQHHDSEATAGGWNAEGTRRGGSSLHGHMRSSPPPSVPSPGRSPAAIWADAQADRPPSSYDSVRLLGAQAGAGEDESGGTGARQGGYYQPPTTLYGFTRSRHGTFGSPLAQDLPRRPTSQARQGGEGRPASDTDGLAAPLLPPQPGSRPAAGPPPPVPPSPASDCGSSTAQFGWSTGGVRSQAQHSRRRGRSRAAAYATEVWALIRLALPCVIITGSTQAIIVGSQVLAGHLGTSCLAAAAVGNLLWLIGYYTIIGCATALETLGAQAVGAGDLARLVVWDFAAGICCTLTALPVAAALWNADVLVAALLDQTPEFCALVLRYCRGLAPGLLPQVWSIVMSKHLQAQSQVLVPAVTVGSGALLYVVVAPRLVAAYGLPGASLAVSMVGAYQCVAMLLAVLTYEGVKGTRWCSEGTWLRGVARWEMARRGRTLRAFLALGAPGGLSAAIESGGWEVTTAMAAYLGILQVAVQSSALSLASLTIMCVPMALAIAVSIRIASLLGSGQGLAAQRCAAVAVVVGCGATAALGALFYLHRASLGWIFTPDDRRVVDLLASIAPLVVIYQVLAGVLGSTQGVLRGLGRQSTLVVHHALGLGAGLLVGGWLTWGPYSMGLRGLWAGSILGTSITALLNGVALALVDWRHEVAVARMMQVVREGVHARQRMLSRALQTAEVVDEGLAETLLVDAQHDPRPLHIIYQEYSAQTWVSEPPDTPLSTADV